MESQVNALMQQIKICVIIPTYNNEKTLKRVIDGVLEYTPDIIIINDGSTDSTKEILKNYPEQSVISLPENKGKGNALRIGFEKAREFGFHHAITIDSDGQHYPDDIPVFVTALKQENRDILLIGNRNMNQEGIPGKSSFGNRFSNFWYKFETGIELEDTQSGYRLYPLNKIPKKYYTPKFEFEIEVIVRTAWNGIIVKNVPIKVLYDPNERVSHFRPFQDFTRISILNTVLVFIALIYIKPRDFIRSFKKKSLKDFIKEDILESNGTPTSKAFSVALGTFIAFSPFWGFHTVLVISLAVFFRLNKVLAFTFSNLSLPPLIPFVILASLKVGAIFIGGSTDFSGQELNINLIEKHLIQYLVGSLTLSTALAVLFGLMTFFLLKIRFKA